MNGAQMKVLLASGVFAVVAVLGCNHDDGPIVTTPSGGTAASARGPSESAPPSGVSAKKSAGSTVYDRAGKPQACEANTSTPENPATCAALAPDTEFLNACTSAGFKTVLCGDCWSFCSGKITLPGK